MYKPYKHKHRYVYKFLLTNNKNNFNKMCCTQEYVLCTDIDGPNNKQNRKLLENMLRVAYNFYPKSVRFSHER